MNLFNKALYNGEFRLQKFTLFLGESNVFPQVRVKVVKLEVREFIPIRTTLYMYKCTVLPIYEFGNIFILGCTKSELAKLQRVQNKNLNLILNRNRFCSQDLILHEAGLLSWEARARLAANRLIFKYKLDNTNIEHYFNTEGNQGQF